MAAEGAGDGWWAVVAPAGAELDPLEAFSAKNMEAIQHPRAFVVLVVLLVADGTLHIYRLPRGDAGAWCCSSWVPLLGSWDNVPCHGRREREWMECACEVNDGKM